MNVKKEINKKKFCLDTTIPIIPSFNLDCYGNGSLPRFSFIFKKGDMIKLVEKDKDIQKKERYPLMQSNFNNSFEKSKLFLSEKKCNKCGRFLSIDFFEKYGGKRGKKGGKQSYRSICKDCKVKYKLVRELNTKFRIIFEHFNRKCYNCEEDLKFLPSYEFHHPDPTIKTSSWRNERAKSYIKVLEWVKRDKVIPLCGNCHAEKQAKYFLLFKYLILKDDLFIYTAENIDNLIDTCILQNPKTRNSQRKNQIKFYVKQWIRKRYVIEQLYEGSCIGCHKINVFNNLPALFFHHIDPTIKESKISGFLNLDCKDIMNIIIKKKIICLCSNCHSVFHSNFRKIVYDILCNYLDKSSIKKFEAELINIYNLIYSRINEFNYNFDKIEFKSPLKLDTRRTCNEIFTYYPTIIYKIIHDKGFNEFTAIELANKVGRKKSTILININNIFIPKNIIEVVEFPLFTEKVNTVNVFRLTDKGFNIVKQNCHSKNSFDIFRNVNLSKIKNKLAIALLTINEITSLRKFNEFYSGDLTKGLNMSIHKITDKIISKLRKNEYISLVKNPIVLKPIKATKVYRLTNKGLKFIEGLKC